MNPYYDRRKANRISLVAVVVIALAFGGYALYVSSVDPIVVSENGISVRTLFGFSLSLSDIKDIELDKKPLGIQGKSFALDAFGLFREGSYNTADYGSIRAFLRNPNVSYVLIDTENGRFALSRGSAQKDELLYDQIKAAMK